MEKKMTMKTLCKWMCLLTLYFLLPVRVYAAYPGAIYISLVRGDVQMRASDTAEWMPASLNMPVLEGDQLWVPEGGRLEMHLIDGTYVRLDGSTSFDVLTVQKTSYQFYLGVGHAYMDFSGEGGSMLQLDTPVSSIRAYDRSRFRVDAVEDGRTLVSVFTGLAYAENREGRTTVNGGESLSLYDTSAILSGLGPPDEWEEWNRDRDRRLAEVAGRSGEYLPGDLQVYSDTFNRYGSWVYLSGYGYCWTPTVVTAGWAPYRIGRWDWIGADYVWISYEPWGWVPFHYGRWLFRAPIGWCWVPPARDDIYWAPGYVTWVHSSRYVSWCPLGPRAVYYGHGHFGRFSVDVNRAGVRPRSSERAYRNIHVRNAVTVVSRANFAAGRTKMVRVRENPFLMKGVNFGRPRIAPSRRSSRPLVKKIPERGLQPRATRVEPLPNLRKTRPLVRRREESVFRPGVAPRQMFLRREERKPLREKPRLENRRKAEERSLRPEERRRAPEQRSRPEVRRRPSEQRLRPEVRRRTPEQRLRPEERRYAPGQRSRSEERRVVPAQRPRPETRRVAPGKRSESENTKGRAREQKSKDEKRGMSPNERGTESR